MEDKLDASEKERNARGQDRVFVGSRHAFYKFLEQIYEDGRDCKFLEFFLILFIITGYAVVLTSFAGSFNIIYVCCLIEENFFAHLHSFFAQMHFLKLSGSRHLKKFNSMQ